VATANIRTIPFTDLVLSGRQYYMNKYTYKSQWTRPTEPAKKPEKPEVS